MRFHLRKISIIPALLSFHVLAFAQQAPELEEIIVTADFRQQSLADITSSVSIIGSDVIKRSHAQHLEDVLLSAPNVNFASGASRARFFQIRGIGERGQFSAPLNSSVGLIIDGVDFSGAGNAALLYDVEQVEILMGPQGTRYGSNALAGLINVQSKPTAPTLAYGIQLDAANYDSTGLAGYVTNSLSENLQFRISAQHSRSNGFIQNTWLNSPTNQHDESLLRSKLNWQAGNDLELDLTLSLIDLDNGYDAFSLNNTRDTFSDEPGFDRQQSKLLSARLTMSKLDFVTMEMIAAYASSDIAYGYDEDWSYQGFHPDEYSATDHYFRERDTYSAEIRFLSTDESLILNGSTSWVFGLYHLQQDVGLRRDYTYLPEDFTNTYKIKRTAAFAESNTSLNEAWSLEIGLRVEQFSAGYADSGLLTFSPEESLSGGKLTLSYHTGNNELMYLSASRGYKAGGFNTDGTLDADLREFGAEKLWNYELGYKGESLNGQLKNQIAVFYMSRKDVQIASSTTRIRPDLSTEFISYTGNAAAGDNYGVELNTQWFPQDNLSFYATAGLLKTSYDNFINSVGINLSGREQAHAPSYQFTLGTALKLRQNLSLNLNIQSKDRFYFSDSHDTQSEKYSLLNASLDWQMNTWQLSLWSRNLGDKDYYVRGYYFGNDPRDAYAGNSYTQLGEPRRIGVTLTADF